MSQSLTIIYTHNLRGDLDRLPHLFTRIQQVRRAAAGQTLLLDLGASCDPEVWHCAVTGGRSILAVLAAMNYDALRVSLTDDLRARLDFIDAWRLVDAAHPWQRDNLLISADGQHANADAWLHISLSPTEQTTLSGRVLHLAALAQGQFGVAHLQISDEHNTLDSVTVETVPSQTPPDSVVAATVDLVIAEARQAQRRQNAPGTG